MKKIMKGFTLIELIIVMAIFAILMVGIMQMIKPIRSTYVDSTLYESQRSAQNGMVTYISESIRYATDLGLYTQNKVSNVTGAVDKFTAEYLTANGITDTTEINKVKENIKKNAEVIIIDYSTAYKYNGKQWTGRILRRKVDGTTQITTNAEVAGSSECRLALGAAYYGDRNCSIVLEEGGAAPDGTWTAADGIKITVTTTKTSGFDNRYSESGGIVKVNGEVVCKNLVPTGNHGVNNPGFFDTANYDAAGALASSGGKVYIVYLNGDVSKT